MPRRDHFQDLSFSGTLSPGAESKIEGDWIPDTDDNRDLGSPTNRWANLYLNGDVNFSDKNANTVFSGPASGAAASPSFRALVDDDIPNTISLDNITQISTRNFSDMQGSTSLGQLPAGAANQVLGTDSGATTQEHKTLSTGTSGTDFAIAHAANSITFDLPDASASARGAVTTGAQTFAGAKTFNGNVLAHDINSIRYANQFTGANLGAKIVNAIADLDATNGGIVIDDTEGAQTIAADIFSGVTKPVSLVLGYHPPSAPITITTSITQPANIHVIGQGTEGTTLSFSSALGATDDAWTMTGILGNRLEHLTIDMGTNGQDALRIDQAQQADISFLRIENAGRDGLVLEPAATDDSIQNLSLRNIEVIDSGRNGIRLTLPDLGVNFINQVLWDTIKVRGSTNQHMVWDLANTNGSGSEKVSGHTFINCIIQGDGTETVKDGWTIDRSAGTTTVENVLIIGTDFETAAATAGYGIAIPTAGVVQSLSSINNLFSGWTTGTIQTDNINLVYIDQGISSSSGHNFKTSAGAYQITFGSGGASTRGLRLLWTGGSTNTGFFIYPDSDAASATTRLQTNSGESIMVKPGGTDVAKFNAGTIDIQSGVKLGVAKTPTTPLNVELGTGGISTNSFRLDATGGSTNASFLIYPDADSGLPNWKVQTNSGEDILLAPANVSAFEAISSGNCLAHADLEIDGDLNHDGSNIGFFGTAPAAQAAAYTPTNVTTDRSYDANSTTVAELADVLGTLISDLQSYGLLQ